MDSYVNLDSRHSGLPCRVGCGVNFRPAVDTVSAIMVSANERDIHEQGIHGYRHVPVEVVKSRYDWGKTHRSVGRGQRI